MFDTKCESSTRVLVFEDLRVFVEGAISIATRKKRIKGTKRN